MTVVWFLSYLCTFLLGGIFTMAVAYLLVTRDERAERRAVKKSLEKIMQDAETYRANAASQN